MAGGLAASTAYCVKSILHGSMLRKALDGCGHRSCRHRPAAICRCLALQVVSSKTLQASHPV